MQLRSDYHQSFPQSAEIALDSCFQRLFKYIRWTVCPHCNSLGLFWEKSESWQFGVNEIPFGVLPALYYNYTLCDYTFLLPRTLLLCCLIWSFYSLLMSSLYVFFLALLSETFFEPNGVYLDSLSVLTYKSFYLISFLSFGGLRSARLIKSKLAVYQNYQSPVVHHNYFYLQVKLSPEW